jgi:hypothetical protein
MDLPTVSECRARKPDYLFICTPRWPPLVERPDRRAVEKIETVAYVLDAPESDSYSEKILSHVSR